jgi:uncharacterized protein DUF4276
VRVTIFLEGGGDAAIECRKGFAKLFQNAGLKRPHSPSLIACGSRNEAYRQFCNRWPGRDGEVLLLLVDSESQVNGAKWEHVAQRAGDHWKTPASVTEDHLWFMMQCMATWIVADRNTLARVFGDCLIANALPPLTDLERRSKADVQTRLQQATARCDRDRKYEKGRRPYQLVEKLDPETLADNLPHFKSLISHLRLLLL